MAPVVVNHHVALAAMLTVLPDACEFIDNNRRHPSRVEVFDESPSKCGYGMSKAILAYPVQS